MEFVYVVKRADLFTLRTPHGLDVLGDDEMSELVERIRERGFFVERRHAELDASFKQIIPYCLVVRGDQAFVTRRLGAGGEARLHGKRSIGIGGHLNPVDEGADALADGLARELDEELELGGAWTARAVGLLNDDSTDVGSVHLGLVYVVRTDGDVAVRETDVLEGGFMSTSSLRELCAAERGSFETWSALLVDRLDDVLSA